MAYSAHRTESASIVVRGAVVTLSDTRTPETDTSGQAITRLLTEAGHLRTQYHLIRDEPAELSTLLDALLTAADVDVIFCTGGTGISRRDRTIEIVEEKLTQTLPGFGELFRYLSHGQIGSGAMLSRAVGGVAGQKLLFAMPGSKGAVELAMTSLILPELRHLVHELLK